MSTPDLFPDTKPPRARPRFILQDEAGQQFVFMVTGNLLKSIPC